MSAAALAFPARIARAGRVAATVGRVYLGLRSLRFLEGAGALRPPDMAARWEAQHQRNAESIYAAAIDLQGLMLKAAQYLGARPDVLPAPYARVLGRLQDRVPPRPFREVRRSAEHALGRTLEQVFARFERTPLAAASLAQVHAAVLRDGRAVAVKVQHPEVRRALRDDLASLRTAALALARLERDDRFLPLVDELADSLPRELDFVAEGRNAERIAGALAAHGDIVVPGIVWAHSSRRLLVMERIEGLRIDDAKGLAAAGIEPARVAQTLIGAWAEQILAHGFFHADPHPGNLRVLRDGRVALLDFGLAKELPAGFRSAVLALAAALFSQQRDALAKALFELGFAAREGGAGGLEAIAQVWLRVAAELRERGQLTPDSVLRLREELPEALRRNPLVRVPGHLVLLGRALALLSGAVTTLGAKLDPALFLSLGARFARP